MRIKESGIEAELSWDLTELACFQEGFSKGLGRLFIPS